MLKTFKTRSIRDGDHSGILRNIIIVNFFFRIFSEGFRTLFVPFSVDYLGLTSKEFGLIQSIGGYAAMGAIVLLGVVVDVRFKKVTMLIGIISALLSAILFPRVTIFSASILFYCLFTIGDLLMMISTNTFIANETKSGQSRTMGLTLNLVFRGLASAIGPISFTLLLQKTNLNYDWVYIIMGCFGFIACILVFLLKLIAEETPKDEISYAQELSEKSGDEYTKIEGAGKRGALFFVQASFGIGRMFMGFASGIAIPFVGLYMYNNFNMTEIQYGLLNSINWLVLTVGYLVIVTFAEKVGKGIIVVIYWTLVIPAAVGLMFAGGAERFYLTAFFFILRFLFAMTPGAIWNSFLFEWISPKHRGKILGILQTGQRGLNATGTLTGGYVFDVLGATIFPIAMIAYPIAGLLPLIISIVVKRRNQKRCLEGEDLAICKMLEEQRDEKEEQKDGIEFSHMNFK